MTPHSTLSGPWNGAPPGNATPAVGAAQPGHSLAARTTAWALCAFSRRFTSLRVYGAHRLHASAPAARIFYANHTSHADILLLLAALPPAIRESARPVAAADYWGVDTLRRFLATDVFRSLVVSRLDVSRDAHPMDGMRRALHAGQSIILFPEGTRGDGAHLRPFRGGIYHLLQAVPCVEVVPVWIQNAHRALPRGGWLPRPWPCAVAFGRPACVSVDSPKAELLAALSFALQEVGRQCGRYR